MRERQNKEANKQIRTSHAQGAYNQVEKIKHATEMGEVLFY